MDLLLCLIFIYIIVGLGMALWDFRPGNALHDPPRFIKDRSVTTAIVFILLWPYKLLRKL
jgi:hypothetical protein